MKLQLIGTGAADWGEYNPENHATRGFASALLDEKILIDCGPTVAPAFAYFGINEQKITNILLTHSHSDHFNIDTLRFLADKRTSKTPIHLWGPAEALKRAETLNGKISLCPLLPGDEFTIGTLKITALEANHTTEYPSERALHYFFETPEGRTLFYALDGAWFLKPTWLFLWKQKIDFIIWDFTIGDSFGNWRIFEHNSLDMIKVMAATFRKEGIFSKETQVVLSHMARALCSPQQQLQKKLDPDGFRLGFDGMSLEI